MISLEEYLILSALLFCISIAGIIINRKNILILLMAIELLLLSINTNFLVFSHFFISFRLNSLFFKFLFLISFLILSTLIMSVPIPYNFIILLSF